VPVAAAQVHVERDQRPPGAHEDRAGLRVEPPRSVVGTELSRVDAARKLFGPAPPDIRGPAPAAALGVEEHGQAELAADASGEHCGSRSRAAHVARAQRHDGHDVGRAHARVDPVVRT
jgi:hypothetical protein